ncbi:MAG: DUF3592 domain-containing protein [Usitatibacteraceae bacterium]
MRFEDDSIVAKIGVSVIGMLVVLLFGGGAYFAGLRPVADAVRTGWRASSLIEVPAKIVDVHIEHNTTKYGKPGALKALQAKYQYEWQGVRYESSLVSLQQRPGVYNSLDWHDEWFEKLDRARKTGAKVPAWVNPEGAPDAVLDKDVRYEGLWVRALLLLCFGTIGLLPIMIVLFIVARKLLNR